VGCHTVCDKIDGSDHGTKVESDRATTLAQAMPARMVISPTLSVWVNDGLYRTGRLTILAIG
jgi:hypothetical protein